MQFINSFISGFKRAKQSLFAIAIIWFSALAITSLLVIPFKSAIKKAVVGTMSFDMLDGGNGISFDFFRDLGENFHGLTFFLTSGIMLVILLFFFVNVFFSGGLFSRLNDYQKPFSIKEFFASSANHFWPFLGVSLIMMIIIAVTAIVLIIPFGFMFNSAPESEYQVVKAALILGFIFVLLLIQFLMIADFARVWLVKNNSKKLFKAIGYGFSKAYGKFGRTYPFALLLALITGIIIWAILMVGIYFNPGSGFGLFLVFIINQVFLFLRFFVRAWRYGGVTDLSETL